MEKINKALILAPIIGLSACGPSFEERLAEEREDRGRWQAMGYTEASCEAKPYIDVDALTRDVERAYVLGEQARHEQLARLRTTALGCRNRNNQ